MSSPSLATRLKASAASFCGNREGQIGITFALTFLPALGLLGAGVDYSKLVKAKTNLQQQVDAAALAASQQGLTSSQLSTFATKMLPNATVTSTAVNTDGSSCISAKASVPTSVMKIAGVTSMSTSATACAINTNNATQTYEIAVALDNTGSMAVADSSGVTKMASEVTAAKNLVTQMFAGQTGSNMQMSIVPFTTAVNVGTGYANASWIDTAGKSSIHWENFPKLGTTLENQWNPASRFSLFSEINQSWGGCVEERPSTNVYATGDLALTDAASTSSNPDSLFVPLFAPDESDKPNSGYSSYNSYISDNGGICGTKDAYDTVDGGGTSGSVTGAYKDGTKFWGDQQQELCKYAVKWAANNLTPSTSAITSAITSVLNNYSYVIWQNGFTSASQMAAAIVAASAQSSSPLYSVSGSTLSFCYAVQQNWNNSYSNQCYNNYWNQQQQQSGSWTTTTIPNYTTSPQGTASSSASTTTSGFGASSSYSPWSGSGWGYGGQGWGTGTNSSNGGTWGWGSGSGSGSCGFNGSTTNPGQTASGQASNLYIGANQFNVGGGANSGCDATLQPLQTLTTSQSTLNTLIGKLQANGATNLVSGFLWAWRTISPNGPFNTSSNPVKAYGAANNKKVLVFMTDGFNNWEPDDSQNGGVYSAFGYYHNARMGKLNVNGSSVYPTASNNRAYLDAAFLQACTNAKQAGIEVYTVAFSIPNAPIDQTGITTVQSCATDANHYFLATSGTQLNTFFSQIGKSITQSYLRLKS